MKLYRGIKETFDFIDSKQKAEYEEILGRVQKGIKEKDDDFAYVTKDEYVRMLDIESVLKPQQFTDNRKVALKFVSDELNPEEHPTLIVLDLEEKQALSYFYDMQTMREDDKILPIERYMIPADDLARFVLEGKVKLETFEKEKATPKTETLPFKPR